MLPKFKTSLLLTRLYNSITPSPKIYLETNWYQAMGDGQWVLYLEQKDPMLNFITDCSIFSQLIPQRLRFFVYSNGDRVVIIRAKLANVHRSTFMRKAIDRL